MISENTPVLPGLYTLRVSFFIEDEEHIVEISLTAMKEDTVSSLGTALQRSAYNALITLVEQQKIT